MPDPSIRFVPPLDDCPRCDRLVAFRNRNRARFPDFHNGPVPSFGPADARLLVVGLAPGLRGANRTGRPFTGDAAGDLLYPMLADFGFAIGRYKARSDDSLRLVGCRITNAVRCVPPENRPIGAEIAACRTFLSREIQALPNLAATLALGRIAHDAVLAACAIRRASHPFAHGAVHLLETAPPLFDSYHCSRYNINTGRLTREMFAAVLGRIRTYLNAAARDRESKRAARSEDRAAEG